MFFETQCTYNSHHNFGWDPTVKKFNPQLFFSQLKHWHRHKLQKSKDDHELIYEVHLRNVNAIKLNICLVPAFLKIRLLNYCDVNFCL